VEPLTADLRRLHVTVSKRFTQKLDAARDALSHSHPGADVETILEAGLDLLIERAAKRKGLVKRPRPVAVTAAGAVDSVNPRHVPAAVRREVLLRDEGKCQWPLADGGICGSTHRVELDHIVPVGRGGRSTASQMRTLCKSHNDLAAREVYGDDLMDRFTRGAGRPPTQHAARQP
jgi:5-methylcytosine-specific restriction endonuclease McrA